MKNWEEIIRAREITEAIAQQEAKRIAEVKKQEEEERYKKHEEEKSKKIEQRDGALRDELKKRGALQLLTEIKDEVWRGGTIEPFKDITRFHSTWTSTRGGGYSSGSDGLTTSTGYRLVYKYMGEFDLGHSEHSGYVEDRESWKTIMGVAEGFTDLAIYLQYENIQGHIIEGHQMPNTASLHIKSRIMKSGPHRRLQPVDTFNHRFGELKLENEAFVGLPSEEAISSELEYGLALDLKMRSDNEMVPFKLPDISSPDLNTPKNSVRANPFNPRNWIR